MLISLANKEQFDAIKKAVIDVVVSNIEAEFEKSVAVELTGNDTDGLRMRFSQPTETFLQTHTIQLPSTVINKASLIKNE